MTLTFSVVMPLYNHQRFVAEAIESVLQQTVADLELIIIDDGSSDQSAAVVAGFNDPRIAYHHQENQGAHAALNRGLELARGEFVALLNSDDRFHPQRLEAAQAAFASSPATGAFFSGYDFIDPESQVTRSAAELLAGVQLPVAPPSGGPDEGLGESGRWILLLLTGNLFHTTSNLVMRRALLPQVGAFRGWRYVHDYDFFLRLCQRTRIVFHPRPLLGYRFHGANTLAENAARSVRETATVMAGFLAQWHPLAGHPQPALTAEIFLHFFQKMRTYGADRLLLALTLTQQILYPGAGEAGITAVEQALAAQGMEETVLAALADTVTRDQTENSLAWQQEQTTSWWRVSQELEGTVRKLTADLAWQQEQTDRWWQAHQQLQADLAWQREQTDRWWGEAQSSGAALARSRRWCGLGGMASWCRAGVHKLWQRIGRSS